MVLKRSNGKRLKKEVFECSLATTLISFNMPVLQVGAPDVSADDQEKINSFNKRWQRLKEINAELEGKKVNCAAMKAPPFARLHLQHCHQGNDIMPPPC